MDSRRRAKFRPDKIEWLLIGMVCALFMAGAILLMLSPKWWGWYLRILDPRYWALRGWICAVAVLVYVLLVIRFWPRPRKPKSAEEPNHIKDVFAVVAATSVLLVSVLCIAHSLIPWPELPWYRTRMVWYWTNRWWVQLGMMAFFASISLLLLGIRAWTRRSAHGKC